MRPSPAGWFRIFSVVGIFWASFAVFHVANDYAQALAATGAIVLTLNILLTWIERIR